jgi:hypothetical protein
VVGVGLFENCFYKLNCNVKLHGGKSASDINGLTIITLKWTNTEVAWVVPSNMHEVENVQLIATHGDGNIDLWHQWLGHLGVEDLKLLV